MPWAQTQYKVTFQDLLWLWKEKRVQASESWQRTTCTGPFIIKRMNLNFVIKCCFRCYSGWCSDFGRFDPKSRRQVELHFQCTVTISRRPTWARCSWRRVVAAGAGGGSAIVEHQTHSRWWKIFFPYIFFLSRAQSSLNLYELCLARALNNSCKGPEDPGFEHRALVTWSSLLRCIIQH